MSKTVAGKQTYKREQEPRTRKRMIEEEKANDFDIPPRTQLHISVDALLHEDDDYHTPATCWSCAMEHDPDYDVDDGGIAYCKGTKANDD